MSRPARIRLSKDPPGYWFDEEFLEGFPDDPRLTEAQRRRVASWSRTMGPASTGATPEAPSRPSSGASRRAAELADFRQSHLWHLLSTDQRELAERPRMRDGTKLEYPLSVAQITDLTGTTADQIRYWSDSGLLPHRVTQGGHRRFFGAAVMFAFTLAGLGPQAIAALRQIQRDEAAPLLLVMANLFETKSIEADPQIQATYRQTATALYEIGAITSTPPT